jgi:trans-2,3-dihydro-3-hydroxyanthranilate isomerase
VSDLTFHVVDVFTDRPYAGNPLAVVLDAEGLADAQYAAIAREFNLSETTFPLRDTEADYHLRIFTPSTELPFAGHPSVGTAWLLASFGRIPYGRVVQRCGAGLLPLTVTESDAELTGGTPSAGEPVDAAPLLASCGLSLGDAGPAAARVCSTGLPWTFVEVASSDAVRRAVARATTDLVVFAWDAATMTSHARAFAGTAGVPEDPATGSAGTAFGAWLAASGYVPADGETSYVVEQGIEIGRPSRLDGTVVTRGGVAVECRVRGGVVPVSTGTIQVP